MYFPAKLVTVSVATEMLIETYTSEQQKSEKAEKDFICN